MKYFIRSKKIAILGLVMLISLSCTKDFEKLNTDPSLLSSDQLDVSLLLTTIQKQMMIDNGAYPLGVFGNYAGYTTSGGNLPFNGGFFPNEFKEGYSSLLNASEIIRLTEGDPELINKHAIARIMKVYIYQHLTDLYGDIPYSQAVQAIDNIQTQPAYDTQQQIYVGMLNELEDATNALDESLDTFSEQDLIYGGNVGQWRRFANSLRLRIALRVSYADEALATNQISSLVGSELIENNDGNAFVTTSTDYESNQNPIYNELVRVGGTLGQFMGQSIIDLLKVNNDPRLTIIAEPTPNSAEAAEENNDTGLFVYRGRPLGLDGSEEREHYQIRDISSIGEYFQQPIIDMSVLYYSEVCFALAEAKLRFDQGSKTAEEWYQSGIRADMERYGIEEDEITNFLNSSSGTLAGTEEEQLEQILSQKNIALFPNAIEAWSEWRRTGYPKILIGSMQGETNGEIPRRINYPYDEANLNSSNYQEVSDRIGGDLLTTRNWWDSNPNVPYEHPGNVLDDF